MNRYRTAEESLDKRIEKKLTQNTEWYKEDRKRDEDEEEEERVEGREKRTIGFRKKKRIKDWAEEARERDEEIKSGRVKGILFVPYTEMSTLAKRIRNRLKVYEELSDISMRVVEKTGERVMDTLHRSNPWENNKCGRVDCRICESPEEKIWGKCRHRNVVYETQCMTCYNEKSSKERKEVREEKEPTMEESGEKRKREEENREMKIIKKKIVKYVGETARSCYERQQEHFKDYTNLNLRSHILKHYLDCHRDIKLEELEFRVRVIGRFRSSFERQIGESIWLNSYLKEGITILNSKNEYNRCRIPRLGLELNSTDALEDYKEKQEEMRLRQELNKMKDEGW